MFSHSELECHSFFPKARVLMHVSLVNCYSAHEALWSQTASLWIGPRLFNSKGGVSVLCGQICMDKLTSYACGDL